MSGQALIVTYHAVEPGPPPLFLDPARFREHLDALAESGATPVGLERLVADLRAGTLPERAVALTFDDGFRSVVDEAAPLLAERGLPATIFCVAGRLGGANDWPSQPAAVPRRPLADAAALAELAGAGFAIGAHGVEHSALSPGADLRREIVDSRARLEAAVGAPVRWFAYPYGRLPPPAGRRLVERAYDGACGDDGRPVRPGADPFALPRVDAHYLRRPARLAGALRGHGSYLALRRAGARARRLLPAR